MAQLPAYVCEGVHLPAFGVPLRLGAQAPLVEVEEAGPVVVVLLHARVEGVHVAPVCGGADVVEAELVVNAEAVDDARLPRVK